MRQIFSNLCGIVNLYVIRTPLHIDGIDVSLYRVIFLVHCQVCANDTKFYPIKSHNMHKYFRVTSTINTHHFI